MTQAVVQVRNVVARSGFANPLTLGAIVTDEDYLDVYADTTLLTNGVHYTITGIGDIDGVEITIIGAEDVGNYVGTETFTAVYDPPLDQQGDLSAGGVLGRAFENALDQQNRRLQALADKVARSPKMPVAIEGDMQLVAPVDGYVPVWNEDESRFDFTESPASSAASAAAAAASAVTAAAEAAAAAAASGDADDAATAAALAQVAAEAAQTAAEAAAAAFPTGGTAGQVLAKASGTDYDTEWVDRSIVSIDDFGAVGDGVTDDTVAIQAALNSGARSVYVPERTYLCGNLLMPSTAFFVLRGVGPASILKQTSVVTAPLLRWDQTANVYHEQTIIGLHINGAAGDGHCIDTRGAGGLTIKNLYITDVPVGYSGVYADGTGSDHVHDTRIIGLQIYSNTAGHSGVRFGPWAADSILTDFIMNGGFDVDYCLFFDAGGGSTIVSDSHPYNAKVNVMRVDGLVTNCTFMGVTFDNALADIISIESAAKFLFSGCFVQVINSGQRGVYLDATSIMSFYNTRFSASAGAVSAVAEANGADYTAIIGGDIGTSGNYSALMNLSGARSYARGLAGYNPLGLQWAISGSTIGSQAQNTTTFLGINAQQASEIDTVYVVPDAGTLRSMVIATGSTPAAGQTFTFNARKNGVTIGTLTVNNGGFGGTLTLNTSVAIGDQITIESVFSATSGSSRVRYTFRFTG